ncbi:hypothetical protein K8R43_01015 [archaeon]|nr:hypothetical protein [archaeon]
MDKKVSLIASGAVFLLVLVVILSYLNILFISLASIALGFYFIGLAFPEIFKKIKYAHTIWVPIGFTLAGFIGFSFLFGQNTFPIIFSSNWCSKLPCFPLYIFFVAFAMGNMANWLSYFLVGEELNLIEGQ